MFYQEPGTGTEHKVKHEQVLLRWKKGKNMRVLGVMPISASLYIL